MNRIQWFGLQCCPCLTRFVRVTVTRWLPLACLVLAAVTARAAANSREYPLGSMKQLSDLPDGAFRTRLEQLPAAAQARALAWLQSFHFTTGDLNSLRADDAGGVFYVCPPVPMAEAAGATTALGDPVIAAAAVPISPFPANLVFHSRPGAPNVLFINFSGETVINSQWNTYVGRSTIPATAFSTDADYTTFSDAEQTAIKRIWQRMAEDYAPFNVDVTTERPATFTTRTVNALITRNTDSNGDPNPASTAGGVAYVNVFATAQYANYRPAWVYYNNLANDPQYIAEAASHEAGHNLGLSHDGRTDGQEYYGGHGSGDTSWGPIMGTGYNRNVSQWSKGDYYRANNTEDDLAIIAGKMTYRTDGIGNTAGTATALSLAGGTNIVSTTPETDPAGTNTLNKGVLERNTDIDVLSFVTGSGPVSIAVNPWVTPANPPGTRGGNLDVSLELYSEAGALLLTNNPATTTGATLQTSLTQGRYYVFVRNSGTGTPLSSTPTGYTNYGSIGQYFFSGWVTAPSGYIQPPVAELQPVAGVSLPGQGAVTLNVSYSDNLAINTTTIGAGDLRVTGPNGYDRPARFVSVNNTSPGTPRVGTYAADPPQGSVWVPADSGTYTVYMAANQVADTEAAFVPAGTLGTFTVSVPAVLYTANMDTDPGWTLDPQWQYGVPTAAGGPTAGFTGSRVIGYNLSGNYAKNLTAKYATTPLINCSGSTSVTLAFKRWLQTNAKDPVSIQVSTNGTTWTDVWSTTAAVSDTAWQSVQYTLPPGVAGSPSVRLRWSLASGQGPGALGWNIDDVQLLAGGNLDTAPPAAQLSVGNVISSGSPSHSCTVTYTDASAVRLASLGIDLAVTGPNGYSNVVEFVGADLPMDGSPISATYSIPAPVSAWEAADNGTYTVRLVDSGVEDIYNNTTPEAVLGTFNVAIPTSPPVQLTVTANPAGWGTVTPSGGSYAAGATVQLLATPALYYRFTNWSGGLTGIANPGSLTLQSNTTVFANFAELMTTNHPTPHWWLASYGFSDFEAAVLQTGANGLPVWQSYIAGLNPTDPQSRLLLGGHPAANDAGFVLNWSTVSNRAYSIWCATNMLTGFAPLANATNLPWTVQSFTDTVPGAPARYYRLEVKGP